MTIGNYFLRPSVGARHKASSPDSIQAQTTMQQVGTEQMSGNDALLMQMDADADAACCCIEVLIMMESGDGFTSGNLNGLPGLNGPWLVWVS